MRFALKDLTIQQKEEREVLYSLKDDFIVLSLKVLTRVLLWLSGTEPVL